MREVSTGHVTASARQRIRCGARGRATERRRRVLVGVLSRARLEVGCPASTDTVTAVGSCNRRHVRSKMGCVRITAGAKLKAGGGKVTVDVTGGGGEACEAEGAAVEGGGALAVGPRPGVCVAARVASA
eukprot:3851099-Rhodomonas_salina.1